MKHPLAVPGLVLVFLLLASIAFYFTAFQSDSTGQNGRIQGAISVKLPENYCVAPFEFPGVRGDSARRIAQWWEPVGQVIFVALPCDAETNEEILPGPGLFVLILHDYETKEPRDFGNDPEAFRTWAVREYGSDNQSEVIAETGLLGDLRRRFPAIHAERYVLLPSTLEVPATSSVAERYATLVDAYAMIDGLPVVVKFSEEQINDATMESLIADARLFMEHLNIER